MKQIQLESKKALQLELESNDKYQRDKQHRLGQEEEDLSELLTDSGSSGSEDNPHIRKQERVRMTEAKVSRDEESDNNDTAANSECLRQIQENRKSFIERLVVEDR